MIDEEETRRLGRSLLGLAIDAGLDPEAFKAAMLADAKWHSNAPDKVTEWTRGRYPGAIIAALKAYLHSTAPVAQTRSTSTTDPLPGGETNYLAND